MNLLVRSMFFRSALLRAVFAVCAVLCGLSGFAQARPVVPVSKPAPQDRLKFDTRKFMPESEIAYGQPGYALTVFHGTRIERFDVKMLGVLKKVNNGKDLILFRVTTGPSVTRQANIAAGMSGSPVYVRGRMVGAIAYGLPFGREPIGLITPIKDMLDSWDPDLPARPGLSPAAATKGLEPAGVTVGASLLAPMAGGLPSTPPGGLTFEPMMTPIMCAGMSPQGIALLASQLAPFRLMPVAGGGMAGASNPTPAQMRTASKALTPGAAVGVSLAQGDIDLTAIGTLTYRDADKIVAFGHPFTGIGPIDAALTTASITDIFPSYQESTKLGMPLTTVGRIFQDRPFSVGGTIGTKPQMIPVSVDVDDQSDNRRKSFHARVLNHPLLTGLLTLSVVNEAIVEAHGTPGDAVAYVTTDVDADQVGHIVRHNVFYDPLAINNSAIGDLSSIVNLLSVNPFYQLGVRSVNVSVRIQDRHATAQIDHIVVPRQTYQPGDSVDVGVVLRPYKQEPVVKTVSLTIPTSTPNGSVSLSVRGGAVAGGASASLDASTSTITITRGVSGDASQPDPVTVQQLVKQFLQQPKNNDLVASLSLPTAAPEVKGEKLSLLPPTMAQIMRTQHASAVRVARDDVKSTQPMPWVITGSQQILLTVYRRDKYDVSTVDAGASAAAPASVGTVATGTTTTTTVTTSPPAPETPSVDEDQSQLPITPADAQGGKGFAADTPVKSVTVRTSSASSAVGTPPAPPALGVAASSPMIGPMTLSTTPAPAPVSRLAMVWRQNTESAFDNGTLDGVAVTNRPDIRVAPSIKRIAGTSASYVWSQAFDARGNLFLGTGDDGLIYRVPAGSSDPVIYARTRELEVTSLAVDAATGDLYAATAPHGSVFRISPAGKATKLVAVKDPYIPALLLGQDGKTLFLTTAGGAGKVYAVDLSAASSGAAPRLVFTSPDAHLLCLAQGADGMLYTGGNPNGVVYRVDPGSRANTGKIVYDSPGATVSAVAVAPNGRLYVGTGPTGAVYSIDLKAAASGVAGAPQLAKTDIARTSDFVSGLAVDHAGDVWAAAGDTLYRVTPAATGDIDDTIATFPSDPPVTYTSIAASPAGSAVTAGTASVGAVYGFRDPGAGASGAYVSAIHDARLKSRWGTIAWSASAPAAAAVQLQTRTGDVPKPDNTWSDWSAAYTNTTGSKITSPAARFIQYRALLSQPASASTSAPGLSSVSVYYLPENRPPTVRIMNPLAGDAVSGNVVMRWTGSDPDRDTLEYHLFSSTDDAQTWKEIDTGATLRQRSAPDGSAATSAASAAASAGGTTGSPNAASVAAANRKLADELAKHPEIPPAVRQKMLQESSSAINGASVSTAASPSAASATASVPAATAASLRAQTFTWNTKLAPDGVYRVKVVASDAPSNATGAQTDEAISDPFTVVNTAPVIALDPVGPTDPQTGQATIRGTVTSTIVFVKAVQYKLDDGDWMAAAASNGLFDSAREPFELTVKPLGPGAHKVTIEAYDRAGNTATQTVNLR